MRNEYRVSNQDTYAKNNYCKSECKKLWFLLLLYSFNTCIRLKLIDRRLILSSLDFLLRKILFCFHFAFIRKVMEARFDLQAIICWIWFLITVFVTRYMLHLTIRLTVRHSINLTLRLFYFRGIIRCVCTQLSFHWKLTDDSGPLFLIVTDSFFGIDLSISRRNFVLIFTVWGSLNWYDDGILISSYWFLLGIALPT